jgi:hypothetical protein
LKAITGGLSGISVAAGMVAGDSYFLAIPRVGNWRFCFFALYEFPCC